MLFNSHFYIFVFLPFAALIYFFFNRFRINLGGRFFFLAVSLLFYGWTHPAYVPLLVGSICFNYFVVKSMAAGQGERKKSFRSFLLVLGISGNILLLVYFKYADFFITNINQLTNLQISLLRLMLPAGVSFFTLNQIGYLVDSWRGKINEHDILSYAQFVSFFPYILAGPIVRYEEVVPQLTRLRNSLFDHKNACEGIFLFFIGLFKKVVLADTLAVWANHGFDGAVNLTLIEAWTTSLSYTLQLHFDFSGYTDMALGSALIFNIKLPVNFHSPYKSFNIQDFWRRWHMTLGRFMRDYVYIPLGGSRGTEAHILANLMITFLIIGIWHGAGWTFIVWGCLHGAAMIVHRLWRKSHIMMPKLVAWFLTFNFVNGAWVFFRAKDLGDAMKVLKGMTGLSGLVLPKFMEPMAGAFPTQGISFGNPLAGINGGDMTFPIVFVILLLSVLFRNSNMMVQGFKPAVSRLCFLVVIAVLSILYLGKHSEFLYFRF
jgi:D-alanyl-lipoteichoic acid acyltransferase DltB (MBOAT superfamily)